MATSLGVAFHLLSSSECSDDAVIDGDGDGDGVIDLRILA